MDSKNGENAKRRKAEYGLPWWLPGLLFLALTRGVIADDVAVKYLGSLSCASTACHGSQDDVAGSVSRSAYARWLESDPHAGAGRTLDGAPFQRILRTVSSGQADGEVDPLVSARCAKCHDPLSGFQHDTLPGPAIGCESCHGPAEKWIAVHYDRDFDRAALRSLGMIDTRDLHVRAAQCVSCHVGDAERDMNHDMIAAGHPPLRFELSAYHDKITRKHWSDAERIATPDFKTQLWAAGQKASADAALNVLESRAARAAAKDKHTPWPEFAEFDCFACHQRLRTPPFAAVALKAGRPGIPGWQPWNLALPGGGNVEPVQMLREALGQSLITDPARIRVIAADARQALAAADEPPASRKQLLVVVERSARPEQSWAASCQQLLAVQAAYLAWRDERRAAEPTLLVSYPAAPRRLPVPMQDWEQPLQQQLEALTYALRFAAVDSEWPAFDDFQCRSQEAPSLLTANEIPATLRQLARQLQSRTTP
jgi:hypothetical protein